MSLVMAVMNFSTKLDIKMGGSNLQAIILLSEGYTHAGKHERRISKYRRQKGLCGKGLDYIRRKGISTSDV